MVSKVPGYLACLVLTVLLIIGVFFTPVTVYGAPTVKYTSAYTTIDIDGVKLLKENGSVMNFTKQTTAQAEATSQSFACNSDCLVEIIPGKIKVVTTQDATTCPEIPDPVECPVVEECPAVEECPEPTDPIPDPVPVEDVILYRVNVAGGAIPDSAGDWLADTASLPSEYLVTGGDNIFATTNVTGSDTSMEAPEQVASTRRTDGDTNDEIKFSFPVSPGTYKVNLVAADSYYSVAGLRIFDVTVNGVETFIGIDPVGMFGKGIAGQITETVVVTGDELVLEFIHRTGNTSISSIEIVQIGTTPTDNPDNPGNVVFNTATLSWDAPTQRENGTALSLDEIAGYQISYWVDVNNKKLYNIYMNDITEVVLNPDAPGLWSFKVRTKDTDGLVGAFSEVVTKEIELVQ